jgi:phenylalanyl-tRNA synthetase beta chain
MMSAGDLELLDLPPEHSARRMVKLSNPITEDESAMRTMVLPGLLRAVSRNVAHRADGVALYELARVYEPADSAALPNETLVLGATFTGTRRARSWMHAGDHWSFFAAKGVLEAMFDALRIEDIRFRPINMMPFHPTRAAHVLIGDRPVGTAGEIHPAVCGRFDVPEGTVAFEIVLDALFERLPGRPKVDELPRYPAIYLDLAIVVDDGVAAERVAALIAAAGAQEVVGSTLFDVYRGDQVPPGKKSLAYSLELRVPDRTLTDADAVRVRDRILVALGERTGAVLRS